VDRPLRAGVAVAAGLIAVVACDEGREPIVVPVDGPEAVDSIAVEPSTARLQDIGATRPFVATAFDAAGDTVAVDVAWASEDVGVATIGPDGVATATGAGVTDILASAGGATGRASLTVALVPEP
jgi:hypothetical protein